MALTKITPQMFDASAAGHDFNIDNGTFVVDASANRVGIGTPTPSTLLDVNGALTVSGDLTVDTNTLKVESGNNRVLVGKSSTGLGNAGVEFEGGQIKGTSANQIIQYLNRTGSNGDILELRKDNTIVSKIGARSGVVSYIVLDPRTSVKGAALIGGSIDANTGIINPGKNDGDITDGALNLGTASSRFKDAHFSGHITSAELTITGGTDGADVYINNTSPTLAFTDSNSFSDADDMYIVRGASSGHLQFQFFDDSANTTTQTFIIDNSGNATFAGSVSTDTIQNASGNLNILSTQNILLRFDSDNNQTNRELNIQNNASDQILKITETGTVTFSGNMLISDGSVSTPAIGFANDTDTGILRVTTNALGITAGGSRKFYVNATNAYFQNLTQVQIDSGNFYVNGHTGFRINPDTNHAIKVLQSSSLTHGGYFQINGGSATGLEINATGGTYSGTALFVQQSSVATGGFLARFANSSGNKVTIETDGTTNFAGNVKASDIIAAGSGGLALQTDEGTKRLFVKDNGDVKVGALAVSSATSAPLHVAKANTDVQAIFGDNNASIDDPSIRIIGRNSANSTARYTFVGLDADANHGFIGYNAGAGTFKNGLIFKTDGVVINELDGKKFFTLTDEFTASANSTTNFKINVSDYTGASAGGYCFYTVSVMGYASGGQNGLTFTYTSGGYSGHNYSATNYNSYGAGTISNGASGSTQYTNVGLSYHPAVNLGGYIASGSVWVYVPAAQQYGVTVVNSSGQGMACFLTIEGWST